MGMLSCREKTMKSKNLRLLIIAICGIVIVTEAILFGIIFGKKSAATAKEEPVQEEKDKIYIVKRVVQWTTPSTTATLRYDEFGRITEIVKNGHFREALPGSDSDYGIRIENYFYDNDGKLVKASYKENDSEWEEDETVCVNKVLRVDYHGGVYYYNLSPGAVSQSVSADSDEKVTNLNDVDPEKYDEEGRLIEKEYKLGTLVKGRHSYFTYEGNTVIREDYDKNGEMMRVCRFEFDDWGRLVLAKTTKEDQETEVYEYGYDENDNIILQKYWGTKVGGDYRTQYSYDENGNLLTIEKYEKSRGIISEEARKYKTFIVKEEYLTEDERKSFGLTYNPSLIAEKETTVNFVSWNLADDYSIMY